MKLKDPLEAVFNLAESDVDIEKDYAAAEVVASPPTEAPVDFKDADDELIEKRIDEVYDTALQAYHNQTAFIEIVDPRFAARNAEVAANYLNIALQAVNSRSRAKTDRKRANQTFVPYNSKPSTQNLIFANREDILKMVVIDDKSKELK